MSAPTDRFAAARADPGLVVLDGFHALKHALRFDAEVVEAVTSDRAGLDALAAELAPDLREPLRALVRVVGDEELRALVASGGRVQRGGSQVPHTRVVAIARRPPFDAAARVLARGHPPSRADAAGAAGPRPIVLLEDPRHLGNVGAVVRVAAAADAAAVLTTGARDPWDPAALRGSAGLHFALPVGRVSLDALLSGRPLGGSGSGAAGGALRSVRPLVALDPAGEPLRAGGGSGQLPASAILAFGTERHGLSDELLARADARLRIEMRAGVSSLNLATAVSAVLFAQRLAAAGRP